MPLAQVRVRDHVAPGAGGDDRSLVQHVGQLCAGAARRVGGQRVEIDLIGQRLGIRVELEDRAPARLVGRLHLDLHAEPARSKQRRVEHVHPVGGGNADHAFEPGEAIELHQQRVQRVLRLLASAGAAGAAAAASDGVDLVDEHDSTCLALASLLEQLTHALGAGADVQLDEVRAGRGEERQAGLSRQCLGQQRLAGAGRAVEQDA